MGEGPPLAALALSQANRILPTDLTTYPILPDPVPPVLNYLLPTYSFTPDDSFPAELVASDPLSNGTIEVGAINFLLAAVDESLLAEYQGPDNI